MMLKYCNDRRNMQGPEFACGRKSLLAVLVVCWSKLRLLHRSDSKIFKGVD